MRILKVGVLCMLAAAAILGVLVMTEVVPTTQLGSVASMTFGSIAILFGAAVAWRAVRGRTDIPDHTDQPVP